MVYWDLAKFSFFRFFSYPWEIIASVIKRIVEVLFLILFWSLVAKSGGVSASVKELAAYFLIAMGVADLTMTRWGPLAGYLSSSIKDGTLNNFLIKPLSPLFSLYSVTFGRSGMRMILAVINIFVGLLVNPPPNLTSILLFGLFFINALIIGFTYNVFEGTLYFYFTEANGLRNTLQHIVRILSGSLAPIYLFPGTLRKIVNLTPFPGMVYGPTQALNTSNFDGEVISRLLTVTFWSVVMSVGISLFWKRSIKKYEAIGI